MNSMRPVEDNPQSAYSTSDVELRGVETHQLRRDPEEPYPALLNALPIIRSGPGYKPEISFLDHLNNPHLWRAGVIEGASSATLAFVSGALGVTLSGWPAAAIPAGIFFGNTILVSLIIWATSATTGAHINANVTISTALCGLCHPARAAVYIFCQLVGSVIGGAFLHASLGGPKAVSLHNGGCWLDPHGIVSTSQASAMEFMATFCLLFLAYGIGLDPRQAQVYGPALGPLLVGSVVGLLTSVTGTIAPGYTGVGIFPGRCFGLAAGMGIFQRSHWIWWAPDIAACLAHSLLYRFAPPYKKEYVAKPPPTIDGQKLPA